MEYKLKLSIGITGASGALYGIRMLETLKKLEIETHLIITPWGRKIIEYETDMSINKVEKLASFVYDDTDLASNPSSGSFKIDGMIIIPCSMNTIASISSGYASTLLTRAADVSIKEGRKLILVPRETPLSPIHLNNMNELSKIGVTILPAMPGFYNKPKSVNDIINHIVGKVLDQLNIKHDLSKPWNSNYKQ